jgi:hypothetical protein
MKKNYTVVFAVIVALLVLCAFWGCSSSDDDDDGPSLPHAEEAGLGNTEITLATGVQVYSKADGTPYAPDGEKQVRPRNSHRLGNSYLAAVISAGSKITFNGNLTPKLPVYTPYWSDYDAPPRDKFLTADPPDVKIARVENFSANSGEFRLDNNHTNGASWVHYMYANKDAIVTGVYKEELNGVPFSWYVNLKLKEGWNSVIQSVSVSNSTVTEVTGFPSAGYRWEVSD